METVTVRNWRPLDYPDYTPKPTTTWKKEPPALIINYPQTGRKTLPTGTCKIELSRLKATLPDGTEEDIYAARSVETCMSLLIYTDQPIKIRLERKGIPLYLSTVFPEYTRLTDAPVFDIIEIKTTQNTAFHITLSEDPYGVPEYIPDHRLTPQIYMGYNAADDLVSIKKVIDGVTYQRSVTDPNIADIIVDRWVEYGDWLII